MGLICDMSPVRPAVMGRGVFGAPGVILNTIFTGLRGLNNKDVLHPKINFGTQRTLILDQKFVP